MLHRAHKIRLYPTYEQAQQLARACGVARFAYNWGLARWNELYATGQKTSAFALRRELNAIKREQFPWMLEVTKCAPMESLLDLGVAFNNFFKKRAAYPKFKRKGQKESFFIDGRNAVFYGCKLRLPKIGRVACAELSRWPAAKLLSVTVKRISDRWYAVVNVELPEVDPVKAVAHENQVAAVQPARVVGVDLGLAMFATLSTGEKVEHPKYLRQALPKLRRLGQRLARKKSDSRNWHKAKLRLSRKHASVANQRKHFIHKLTTDLARRFDHVVLEDLNVEGMAQFGNLARSVYETGMREFRRQCEYKTQVTVADRFFPSSQLCSHCGAQNRTLKLSDRSWSCTNCNTLHDHDINAAINLKHLGQTASSPGAISALAASGDLHGRSMNEEICTK